MREDESSAKMASSGGGWAAMVKKDAAVGPKLDIPELLSSAGLKTVVVDANALIGGGIKLSDIADQFVTIQEVLDEVRDPASRFHLATLPVTIRCVEPSSDALAAVIKFARATGDLQSLSSVDLKLIALAYTLEAQVHGTAHIRSRPPPLLLTPSSTHKHPELPGWGFADNAEEWEGMAEEEEEEVEKQLLKGAAKPKSRILGLKPLNLDDSESAGAIVSPSPGTALDDGEEGIPGLSEREISERLEGQKLSENAEDLSLAPENLGRVQKDPENLGRKYQGPGARKGQSKSHKKDPVPSLEGKLNVAEGLDASKGELALDGDDWERASCRTSRRNFLKREAKREARRQAVETASAPESDSVTDSVENGAVDGSHSLEAVPASNGSEEHLEQEEDIPVLEDDTDENGDDGDEDSREEKGTVGSNGETDDLLSVQSEGVESEESWMVGPTWRSSIACMTGDFAMQNVILQMGLRLLSTKGMHIRELNKWVLKCQACNHVTADVGRIFCPKCGNGGTLFKVSVTVGQNGTVLAGRARRTNLRGTRYSLPMPKGGREGAVQNPILREDQLPNKILHPRTKKTMGVGTFDATDVTFRVVEDNKLKEIQAVKSAASIFGGRRNPNERRHGVHR